VITFLQSARDVHVIRVEGPLRVPVNSELRHEIRSLLDDGVRAIVLDLANVSDIDAAGVGEIVHLHNLAAASNGTLQIVNSTAKVQYILDRVGLWNLLTQEHV
jgi:anti-anti-sigma factor